MNVDPINDGILWKLICDKLPKHPGEAVSPITNTDIWCDGDQIMVDDGRIADAIADFMEALGVDAHTGYYDPEEDEQEGVIDQYTGYWYVDID